MPKKCAESSKQNLFLQTLFSVQNSVCDIPVLVKVANCLKKFISCDELTFAEHVLNFEPNYFITFHSAPSHYHLEMHVFDAITNASILEELDVLVQSAAVVFSSPCCGANVEKRFKNLQSWLQKIGTPLNVTTSHSHITLQPKTGYPRS